MAKITVKSKKTVTIESIDLSISLEEAVALTELLYKVGGSPTESFRGELNRIAAGLTKAGIRPSIENTFSGSMTGVGTSELKKEVVENVKRFLELKMLGGSL